MATAHGSSGDDDLLADEVATMIVAGHETTALALFWSCLVLANLPDQQAAIAAEAAQPLAAMRHTQAFLQEVLRLYPPAFMTARLAMRPHVIEGTIIPAGAIVLLPFWLLHRHPELWPEPAEFHPTRFLDTPEPDRFAYLPFGAGPHICIGAQLAMTEATLVLVRLMQMFKIECTDTRPVLPVGMISTRPDHPPDFKLSPR
jgi:cytochrome P450